MSRSTVSGTIYGGSPRGSTNPNLYTANMAAGTPSQTGAGGQTRTFSDAENMISNLLQDVRRYLTRPLPHWTRTLVFGCLVIWACLYAMSRYLFTGHRAAILVAGTIWRPV